MNKEKEPLKLLVRMNEAKLIFKALGKLPFEEVYELIGSLNAQINEQTSDENQNDNNEHSQTNL